MLRLMFGVVVAALLAAGASAADDLSYRVETVASGLNNPWSLAFLPDGDMLVTEKYGDLRILRHGVLDPAPITGLPPNILKQGDCGLLDIALDPDFASNRRVFIAFNEGTAEANHLALFRATFDGHALSDGMIVFRSAPDKKEPRHSGGRILFLSDKTLLLTVSDGFLYRDEAQNLGSDLGKLVRIDRDGQPPADNPFIGKPGVRPEIYTWGHRNALGLLCDPRNGDIWLHENGPKGGDEVNLIKPGLNYGWPKTTYGIDYSGDQITKFTELPDVEPPIVVWVPSIAPSGFALYLGDKFPQWKGDFFVGALAEQSVRRLRIRDHMWTEQEILLRELHSRIRDVRAGPDGYIYLLTDADNGQLLRLVPGRSRAGVTPEASARHRPPDHDR